MTCFSAALLLTVAASLSRSHDGSCELDRADRRTASAAQCLSCHDGSAAPAITTHGGMDTTGSHPVGVNYLSAYHDAGSRAGLVAPWRVDSNFAFPNGTVTCVTCHDARGPGRLAVPIARMCVGCHDK